MLPHKLDTLRKLTQAIVQNQSTKPLWDELTQQLTLERQHTAADEPSRPFLIFQQQLLTEAEPTIASSDPLSQLILIEEILRKISAQLLLTTNAAILDNKKQLHAQFDVQLQETRQQIAKIEIQSHQQFVIVAPNGQSQAITKLLQQLAGHIKPKVPGCLQAMQLSDQVNFMAIRFTIRTDEQALYLSMDKPTAKAAIAALFLRAVIKLQALPEMPEFPCSIVRSVFETEGEHAGLMLYLGLPHLAAIKKAFGLEYTINRESQMQLQPTTTSKDVEALSSTVYHLVQAITKNHLQELNIEPRLSLTKSTVTASSSSFFKKAHLPSIAELAACHRALGIAFHALDAKIGAASKDHLQEQSLLSYPQDILQRPEKPRHLKNFAY